jgi:predicted nucleic-acid-binding Zn-ribbon protein
MSDKGSVRALFRGFWRPEIARTCNECGYSWKAPRYYTKRHASVLPGRATAKDALLSEEATFDICAKCGSKHFSQKRVWLESKPDFEGDDQ